MLEIHTWEKEKEESAKSFQAFRIYRDLGPARSIRAVARKLSKSSQLLKRWSSKYDWVNRSQAFDAYLELQARKEKEQQYFLDIEAYRERQKEMAIAAIKSAMAILKKANDRLSGLKKEDITPNTLPSYFRAAAAIAEIALKNEGESLGIDELLKVLQDGK